MNAKDAILYLYDKGLLNIDAIMKNKDSIMQELDNTTEKLTKHDPCRLFKKGDKVRVVEYKGRRPGYNKNIYKVGEDEEESGRNIILKQDGFIGHITVDAAYLELVTPAEEMEPYYIETETFDYEIRNANDDPDIETILAFHIKFQDPDERQILSVKSYYESYVYSREHAEADAEAERDRLNAEWRKEQNQ